jgi:DNA modification methylase
MDAVSVDAVVTDPPYELGFMGKAWDASGVAFQVETWEAVLRVLKPGGHLLAFGGTRTYHRMTCAIEDAGFEIRDCLQWIYGSGFPKSLDVSKAIDKAAGAEREVIGRRTRCVEV